MLPLTHTIFWGNWSERRWIYET